MSDNLYLAKTLNKETILEHTKALVDNFKIIESLYKDKNKYLDEEGLFILRTACEAHDLGKCCTKFQNKLYVKLGINEMEDTHKELYEVPHGYLSCAFVDKKYYKNKIGLDGLKILMQAIYYHHARKCKYDKDEIKDVISTLVIDDLSKYKDEIKEIMSGFDFKFSDELNKRYNTLVSKDARIIEEQGDIFYRYIVIKGLLNKIDYSASSHNVVEIENKNLLEKVDETFTKNNFKLNDLQQYMSANKNNNIVVVASTGIGKTEGALEWIGNNKGFFTLPLMTSINAIFDRIYSKIDYKDVGLLHSDTLGQYDARGLYDDEYYNETKQLALPLTISTIDQLIDFIFKFEGFEMKLATLSYSHFVVDEIQAYSSELMAYLLVALRYIDKVGGKFCIMTATLPPFLIDLMRELNINFEIPRTFIKKNKEGKAIERHKITCLDEEINAIDIANNYKGKKILVIVNTIKKAQQLYDELVMMNLDTSINIFHSHYTKIDRKVKEHDIFEFGQLYTKVEGIWITTQVVEASLDIDFDVLYTELSDLSSLFQRLGRVYRNRELEEDSDTNAYVYTRNCTGIGYVVDRNIFAISKEAISGMKDYILSEEEKMKIINENYTTKNLEAKAHDYLEAIRNSIKDTLEIEEYSMDKHDVRLRKIDNISVIPLSVYNSYKDTIDKALSIINNKEIDKKDRQLAKNTIRDLTININYNYDYKNKIVDNGLVVDTLIINDYESYDIVDVTYNSKSGLDLRNCNKSIDNLII